MTYRWEKFFVAVQGLASGTESIQQRVAAAYMYSLIHLKPDELPPDLRHDFIEIKERLTKEMPDGDEGSVQATVRKMSADEASEMAKKIVSMFSDIAGSDWRA